MIQIHGVITDPAGKPVPRALIELRALSSTSEVLMGSAMTFKCEQDGGYRFQLAAGTYDVYAQNDLCGDMDYMGTGVVAAQSTDGPLNSILVDSGINLTPPLLDRAVEAMQRSEAAAEATAEDRLQTGNDVVTAEQAMQVATEQAAAASTSAATAGSQAGDAATSAGDAAGSASRAQKWADNPVDVAVVPGKHSALHHATKASASASESATSATAAAASASTASAKATSASTSATTATAKASEAAASASTAATHASAANSSKVAAATSATNAGTHASNAEKAAQAAEGVKVVTLDNAARVGTLAEQVTADRTQVQEKTSQVAANAVTVAGQAKEVSTNTDTVSQAKTAVQGMRDVVVAKTTQAQAAADTASTKASQAAQDQASANASSQRASVSEGMAEAWAQNPEGSDINGRPGEFSALHWALQAQKWAQAITSQLVWAGPWNAAAGAPAVPVANQGVPFYRISHPGVIASVSYVAGDYLHWDPATRTWFKIDGSDAVISVNGMTGAVVLSAADVGARPASWVPGWADITNKPVTMPPSEHSHPWSQISNVPVYASRWPTLAEVGAAAASHTHPWSQLTGIPTYATRWPAWGEVTDKPDLAAASHRHPWNQIDQIPVTASRWPTWSEVTGKPSIAAAAHRHPWSELNEVPATASRWPSYDEVTDKPDFAAVAHRHSWSQLDQVPVQATRWPAWGEVTGKPGTMPPSAHTHAWADVTGAPAQATRWPAWGEVTGKPSSMPPSAHNHPWSELTGVPTQATRWPAWGEVTDKPDLAAVDHSHLGSLLNPISLAKEDLDTIKTPGHYAQHANANTSAAQHYPENSAGSLIVTSGAGPQQRYHVYNSSRVWTRAQYSTGAWTAWARDYNTLNKPSAADVGVGTVIFTGPVPSFPGATIPKVAGLYAMAYHNNSTPYQRDTVMIWWDGGASGADCWGASRVSALAVYISKDGQVNNTANGSGFTLLSITKVY
ncbi:prophage tail fiber N-terminal domain-containing protein [Aeromonas tecta]|uniref:prophage tail fiber N-terminal domain-containing protein n=1 Tax=Aeromonas tecta TaxID=324617 RepID=UPI0006808C3B|nr:prophage tail fiber N-terminal domain-containing protein [Aeromonas tecta]